MGGSDAEVIKEFLVSVGVKLDEGTLGKFDNIVASIGGKVLGLVAVLGTAALATEKFVDKIATGMEDLYWTSQRLHSGVAQIQDYGLAIKNLGGDADSAKSSLENIARLLRTNPGYSGFLSSLGVNPNQGAVGISKNLVKNLKSKGMPYFVAERYGEMFGIDEKTFWAQWNDKTGAINGDTYAKDYKAAHTDPDKAAKDAHDLEVQLRATDVMFSVLATNMMTHLLPAVKEVNAQVLKAAPGTLKHADATGKGAGDALAHPGTFFEGVKRNYVIIASALLDAGQEAIKRFIPGAVAGQIYGQARNLGLDPAHASALAANAIAESGGNPNAIGDNGSARGLFQFHKPRQNDFRTWSGFDITDKRATAEKQIQFLLYEMTKGNERAAGAKFFSAHDAASAGDALSRFDIRPKAVDRDAAIRAGYATKIEMHQKTDIHVAGGSNASATAAKVAGQQDRVNGDLVRNLKGPLQ